MKEEDRGSLGGRDWLRSRDGRGVVLRGSKERGGNLLSCIHAVLSTQSSSSRCALDNGRCGYMQSNRFEPSTSIASFSGTLISKPLF